MNLIFCQSENLRAELKYFSGIKNKKKVNRMIKI
jgi:hypothetical protein